MPTLITTAAAAKILGVGQRRVRAMIAAGLLPATKITEQMYLIDPKDVAKVPRRAPGRPKK